MRPEDRYVNGDYATVSPTWHKEDSPWKAKQIMRVIDLQARHDLGTICDIGCGSGGVLAALDDMLQECGINLLMTGYDIAPGAIERARANHTGKPNIKFERCDVLSLNELECDLCLLMDVLEHIDDPKGFIDELCQRGVHEFVIHLPLENNWLGIMRGKTDPRCSPVGHLHFYDTHSALSLLERAGLEIIKWVYTPELDLDLRLHRTFKSTLAYLPRKMLSCLWPAMTVHTIGGLAMMAWCRSASEQQ